MRNRRAILLLGGLLVVALVALGIWTNRKLFDLQAPSAAIPVSADSIDADNEARLVRVSGRLSVDQAPEDPQMGLHVADAIVLVREVEMLQWQEVCDADSCTLQTKWSPDLIDSTRFSEAAEHRNPDRFPIASDRFVGKGVRLGAFFPDVDLLVSSIGLTPRPVTLAELPGNLAASFSVSDNALFSGKDPEHPGVGDLRIRFRIIAGADVSVTGIQQSSQLVDPAYAHKP